MKNLFFCSLLLAMTFGIQSCSNGYAKMVINEADKNDDDLMTFEEYLTMVSTDDNYKVMAKGNDKTVKEYARGIYSEMDKNGDKFVDKIELKEYTFQ